MTPEILRGLTEARAARCLAVLLTRLADGAQHLLVEPGAWSEPVAPSLLDAARRSAESGRSGTTYIDGQEWFVQVHAPKLRLIVIGAVHVAQALAPLAAALGMAVSIVDPRSGFATVERFATAGRSDGVELLELWPDEAMARLRADAHTAVVTLSHEARLDDPALDAALQGPAFYIGALGSRRTQAARRERLAALGHDAATLARLHGPVGLAIGAVGPEEIALSIMAEIVAVRRGAAR